MELRSSEEVRPSLSAVRFSLIASVLLVLCPIAGSAQIINQLRSASSNGKTNESSQVPPSSVPPFADAAAAAANEAAKPEDVEPSVQGPPQFRVERLPISGGAELLTIFGRMDGMRAGSLPSPEVPLLAVVRDTLTDADPDNDRLRYLWMLTYTRPTLIKRVLSAVPFLYQHLGNKTRASRNPPSPLIDLANARRQTWNNFFWFGLQNVLFDSYGIPLRAASRSYRRNATDYQGAHVTQALSILGNYENLRRRVRDESEMIASREISASESSSPNGAPIADVKTPLLGGLPETFTPGEVLEMRARLILSGKMLGGLYGPDKFEQIVTKRSMAAMDSIGHNWEMLRQRAELEGLWFQPLTMPDGTATHALLWIARSDLAAQPERSFGDRFLNISNPWKDRRLRDWTGYREVRYFDRENRPANAGDPQAKPIEMIPLALYGLDHKKIPALLIDFRDNLNPKKREVSGRFFRDLTKNIFSFSSFGNLPYFVGRKTFDFITGRRGMDINQPTRLGAYSELKLLLSFNSAIEPGLRKELEHRLENVSVNPLANDNAAEIRLAEEQYDALIEFARRPDGLAAKIEKDRLAEMTPLVHGPVSRFFFGLGNVLSFGRYVHREQATPELAARLETARVISYHTNILTRMANSSPETDVAWDMGLVRHSLEVLAARGAGAGGSAARAAATIFRRTKDEQARRLCLDALYKIKGKSARQELVRLYNSEGSEPEWRAEIAERVRKAIAEDTHLKPAEAKSLLTQVGQP